MHPGDRDIAITWILLDSIAQLKVAIEFVLVFHRVSYRQQAASKASKAIVTPL